MSALEHTTPHLCTNKVDWSRFLAQQSDFVDTWSRPPGYRSDLSVPKVVGGNSLKRGLCRYSATRPNHHLEPTPHIIRSATILLAALWRPLQLLVGRALGVAFLHIFEQHCYLSGL